VIPPVKLLWHAVGEMPVVRAVLLALDDLPAVGELDPHVA